MARSSERKQLLLTVVIVLVLVLGQQTSRSDQGRRVIPPYNSRIMIRENALILALEHLVIFGRLAR